MKPNDEGAGYFARVGAEYRGSEHAASRQGSDAQVTAPSWTADASHAAA